MSPARLREIADTLPGYVCGQLQTLADAWERDLASSAALRIEHEAHAALLAATRAERDRLRESAAAAAPDLAATVIALSEERDRLRAILATYEPAEPGKNTP